ncbi:S1 RNA-binding domain-containing protein [Amycolatopsis coloradensis]|uniref:S1 RNA-binding domain-containing protein n=1 Tax=Amycolatopsis coloradensis TaxID=76021 RepID=A0ACD5BLU2_9PSEU
MSPTENWREFVAAHADGGVLDGVVTRVLPFGAFVEVAQGMEGLLPTVGGTGPLTAGAAVAVRLDKLDVQNRRFSLILA